MARTRKTGEKMPYADIGARVRWVREQLSPTITVVARSLGCDQSVWSKYESGERRIPLRIAQPFADRADVTLDFLLRGRLRGLRPETLERLASEDHHLVIAPGGTDRRTDKAPS